MANEQPDYTADHVGRMLQRKRAVDTYYVRTYHVSMNVTLSVDTRVLAEARRIAAIRGTSLNQLIRDYLHDLTRHDDVEASVRQLEQMWSTETARSQGPWTREELHERS